jgi:glycosyltransferase involved in cell wall biosynthesis
LAFNPYMRDEFRARYDKEFSVLMHGDVAERFHRASSTRAVADARPLIVCTGDFDKYRWSLLEDVDVACESLARRGFNPCVVAYPVNLNPHMVERGRTFRHVRLAPCPGHEELVSVLLGSDILFLPERFGPEIWDIRCSVSSKAHIFMFSERPILVYSDPATGIARYAREEGWAAVVDRRDPLLLAGVLERLITDQSERQRLIAGGRRAAMKNHHLPSIQSAFYNFAICAVQGTKSVR